jgi:hypothetical protein
MTADLVLACVVPGIKQVAKETAAGTFVPVHEGLQRCVLVFSKQHKPHTPAIIVMICHPANSKCITDQSMGLNWGAPHPPCYHIAASMIMLSTGHTQ